MTSLAPVSRAVPQERTPLNLLPPSQPRPTAVTEETTTSQPKDIAVVDSNKSFASLFGSKSVTQPEQDSNEQNRTHDNQSNQGQYNQGQDRGHSSDRFDRPYSQNNQQQHSNQNQNDRNFPSFNQQRNDSQRDRDRDGQGQGHGQDRDDRHWNENNNNNNNNNNNSNSSNNNDDQPQNTVARKRQLFDPKSNKMVDPELHPENLPPTENQKSRGQNQGQGQGQGEKNDTPQDILKRARPAHPRFDEFDNTWRRGVSNPKNKDKDESKAVTAEAGGESNGAANEVRM